MKYEAIVMVVRKGGWHPQLGRPVVSVPAALVPPLHSTPPDSSQPLTRSVPHGPSARGSTSSGSGY